jgi:hypothetical protein
MYVAKEPYLVTYTEPVGLIQTTFLNGSKTSYSILEALKNHIASLTMAKFTVKTMLSDQEFMSEEIVAGK